jgi:hypothetical protein
VEIQILGKHCQSLQALAGISGSGHFNKPLAGLLCKNCWFSGHAGILAKANLFAIKISIANKNHLKFNARRQCGDFQFGLIKA